MCREHGTGTASGCQKLPRNTALPGELWFAGYHRSEHLPARNISPCPTASAEDNASIHTHKLGRT